MRPRRPGADAGARGHPRRRRPAPGGGAGLTRRRSLRLVVTAGPTREPLDAVRFLSNASSGRMGFAVAAAARRRGHRVVLVTGPVDLAPPAGVRTVRVEDAREMRRETLAAFEGADALVMTAAVSDYRPARRRRGKWKSGPERLSLPLVRNPDILAEAGRRKGDRVTVGFAVETGNALARARGKLARKRLDALCLCDPSAFGTDAADYLLLLPGRDPDRLRAVPKATLATRLVRLVETLRTGATRRQSPSPSPPM